MTYIAQIAPESIREDDVVYLEALGECRAVDKASRDGDWVFVTMEVDGMAQLFTFHHTENLWWMGRVALPDDDSQDLVAPR